MKNYNYFEEKNEKIPSRMKFFIYWIITSDIIPLTRQWLNTNVLL